MNVNRQRGLILMICFGAPFTAIWLTSTTASSGHPIQSEPFADERTAGPYCGISSVYMALRSLQIPVSFDDLAQSKYVGSNFGSSAYELQQAVNDHGAKADVYHALTVAELRSADSPFILHVRQAGLKTEYRHWVLFLGCQDHFARVVDPPNGLRTVAMAELLAIWDGKGLCIRRQNSGFSLNHLPSWIDSALAFCLVLGLFMGVKILILSQSKMNLEFMFIPIVTVISCIGWHTIRTEGYFQNPDAVASVYERYRVWDFPEISVESFMERQSADCSDIILDARLHRDYSLGHIPGAINIPITASWLVRNDLFNKIPKGRPIVVYCQTRECRWADEIAAGLASRGFTKISLLRGGYHDWSQFGRNSTDRK